MVGGIVIGIVRKTHLTVLHVQDARGATDTCCVSTSERRRDNGMPVQVQLGDRVWWQSDHLLWTPRVPAAQDPKDQGKLWDIDLGRTGGCYDMSHLGGLSREELSTLLQTGQTA